MKLYLNVDNDFIDLNTYLQGIAIPFRRKSFKTIWELKNEKDAEKVNNYLQKFWLFEPPDFIKITPLCDYKLLNQATINELEKLRDFFPKGLYVNSLYRPIGAIVYGKKDYIDCRDFRGHWLGLSIDIAIRKTAVNNNLTEDRVVEILTNRQFRRPFLKRGETWHFRYTGNIWRADNEENT